MIILNDYLKWFPFYFCLFAAYFAILTVCHSGQFQAGGEWPALDALSGLHDQISQLKDWLGASELGPSIDHGLGFPWKILGSQGSDGFSDLSVAKNCGRGCSGLWMSESASERYKSRKVCCRTLIQVPSHHSHPVANGPMAARHARSLTKRQLRKPWLCARWSWGKLDGDLTPKFLQSCNEKHATCQANSVEVHEDMPRNMRWLWTELTIV